MFPLILHNWRQKFMYNSSFLDPKLYIYLSEIGFLAHWLCGKRPFHHIYTAQSTLFQTLIKGIISKDLFFEQTLNTPGVILPDLPASVVGHK